jgi:hypothetical protein
MRQPSMLVWLVAPMFFAACASLDATVRQLLAEGKFKEARSALDQAGAGSAISQEDANENGQARAAFTKAIEDSTEAQVGIMLSEGKTRMAALFVQEREDLCPWSIRIADIVRGVREKTAQVLSREQAWQGVMANPSSTLQEVREILKIWASDPLWAKDSEVLYSVSRRARARLEVLVAERVTLQRGRQSPSQRQELLQDLELASAQESEAKQLMSVVDVLAGLPVSSSGGYDVKSAAARDALATARLHGLGSLASRQLTPLGDCASRCWDEVTEWIVIAYSNRLRQSPVDYEDLSQAESWSAVPPIGNRLVASLAEAHINTAARLAPHPYAASMAIVHIHRATCLGLPIDDARLKEALSVADATRAATPKPTVQLSIKCDKSIDPAIEHIASSVIRNALASPGKALCDIQFAENFGRPLHTVELRIASAERVADVSDVKSVASTYMSHQQRVPNPRKKDLEIECGSARMTAEFAELDYERAVSSHNIYPTQWSLNDVNWARSRYIGAVDNYNSLVDLYNATSATIVEPVYMPYRFSQGRVRFGWRLSVAANVFGQNYDVITRESVVSDFVRRGAKSTDKISEYRRDDGLDINVSAESSLEHLQAAVVGVREVLNGALGKVPFKIAIDIAPEQAACLAWMHHPLGMQSSIAPQNEVPSWFVSAAESDVVMASLGKEALPPAIVTRRCEAGVPWPQSAEGAHQELARFVCQTLVGGSESGALGTGVLIGPEGLILTCAHALSGGAIKAEFHGGPWRGIYDADIVFINSRRDVAVIRARNIGNSAWANVRQSSSAAAGEAVVAIGNPSLGVGGSNIAGVSQGIVSNPRLNRSGVDYLAADIAVASGSSGGPIFSLKDGALVGIVQMAATVPGLQSEGQSVSSTGYLCLAAPATLLEAWLGLVVKP